MSYPTSPPDFQSKNPSKVARQGLPVNGFITWKLSVCPSATRTCPGFKSTAFLTIKGLTLSFNAFSPSRARVHLSKLLSRNHSAYRLNVISLGKISCPRSFRICFVKEIAFPLLFIEANNVGSLSVDTQKDLDFVRKIISEKINNGTLDENLIYLLNNEVKVNV